MGFVSTPGAFWFQRIFSTLITIGVIGVFGVHTFNTRKFLMQERGKSKIAHSKERFDIMKLLKGKAHPNYYRKLSHALTIATLFLYSLNEVNFMIDIWSIVENPNCTAVKVLSFETVHISKGMLYSILALRLKIAFGDSSIGNRGCVLYMKRILYFLIAGYVLLYIPFDPVFISGYVEKASDKYYFCNSHFPFWGIAVYLLLDLFISIICLCLFVVPLAELVKKLNKDKNKGPHMEHSKDSQTEPGTEVEGSVGSSVGDTSVRDTTTRVDSAIVSGADFTITTTAPVGDTIPVNSELQTTTSGQDLLAVSGQSDGKRSSAMGTTLATAKNAVGGVQKRLKKTKSMKMFKISKRMKKRKQENRMAELLSRYVILAAVAIISTFVSILFFGITAFGVMAMFDNLINSICMIFLSTWYTKHYQHWCRPCIAIGEICCSCSADDFRKMQQQIKESAVKAKTAVASSDRSSGLGTGLSVPQSPQSEGSFAFGSQLAPDSRGDLPLQRMSSGSDDDDDFADMGTPIPPSDNDDKNNLELVINADGNGNSD